MSDSCMRRAAGVGERAGPGGPWTAAVTERRAPRLDLPAQAAMVFLAALAVRVLGAGQALPSTDEFYTILAARSYLADGSFGIWHGQYVRARGFTAMVAASLWLFGDTPIGARAPSMLAGAALVGAAFWWMHRACGASAAWVLAVLLGLSQFAIEMSRFARFYALHALLFWIVATALLGWLAQPATRSGAARLAVAAICLAAALHLQATTLIGLVAIASGLAAAGWVQRPASGFGWWSAARRRQGTLLASGLLLMSSTVVAAWLLGAPARLAMLFETFRWAAPWNAENRDYIAFYYHHLVAIVPLVVYTLPVAALVALASAPRTAAFCLVLAGVAIGLHSFGGMKSERYVFYAYPFLLAIPAIAIGRLLPALRDTAAQGMRHFFGRGAWARPAAAAAVVVALVAALLGNPDFEGVRALPRAAASELAHPGRPAPTEAAARSRTIDAIRAAIEPGAVVLTSDELRALWHLGRYDLTLSASRLAEYAPGRDFAPDPRTGGPVIAEADSLRHVIDCHAAGVVLFWEKTTWQMPWAVPAEMRALVEARLQPVDLPRSDVVVRAWRWRHPAATGPSCDRVRAALAPRAATGAQRLPSP